MDRDALLNVDTTIGMHEMNPALAFALAVKHFLTTQQRPADTHVLAEVVQSHRRQALDVA
ncbi:MAG TPA: hypothetical protein VHY56_01125 [Candidatus Binataceae bacterium]|nr:hypothetical protein [Candidatus Binataceae bacterium]